VPYSFNHPPAGLNGFLRLIWPLIFVQLVALKAWARKHYGPGVPYWYGITKWGRVYLRHLPTDFAQSYAAPGALRPAAPDAKLLKPSVRLADALAAETCDVPAPAPAQTASSVHVLSGGVRFDTS
jgi:hypothetical protein